MNKKKLNISKENNCFVTQKTTHENTMTEEFWYLDAVAKASNNKISSEHLFLLVNEQEKAIIRDCEIIANVF